MLDDRPSSSLSSIFYLLFFPTLVLRWFIIIIIIIIIICIFTAEGTKIITIGLTEIIKIINFVRLWKSEKNLEFKNNKIHKIRMIFDLGVWYYNFSGIASLQLPITSTVGWRSSPTELFTARRLVACRWHATTKSSLVIVHQSARRPSVMPSHCPGTGHLLLLVTGSGTVPGDITSAPSLSFFRRKLKTNLFRQSWFYRSCFFT